MNTQLPKVVQDCHDLLLWIIPILDKFPRNRRFTLGERQESGLLLVLEYLIEATYIKSKRKQALTNANLRLQIYSVVGLVQRMTTLQRMGEGNAIMFSQKSSGVGWVEPSETHHFRSRVGGFLQKTLT